MNDYFDGWWMMTFGHSAYLHSESVRDRTWLLPTGCRLGSPAGMTCVPACCGHHSLVFIVDDEA